MTMFVADCRRCGGRVIPADSELVEPCTCDEPVFLRYEGASAQ